MSDDKKTFRLPVAGSPLGPHERPTEEVVTGPILLAEMRGFRAERREHDAWTTQQFEQTGKQFTQLFSRVSTIDDGLKNLGLQVQQNLEVQNGKIRAGEGRLDSLEARAHALETFRTLVETELKAIHLEQAKLLGLSPEALEAMKAAASAEIKKEVSLSEDQMKAKLEAEAKERTAVATEVRVVRDMLVQSLGIRPPPPPQQPNPDGSIPPGSTERPKKEPKNAIEKSTMWSKIAAGMMGVVVTAGTLKEMGFFSALKKLLFGD